MLDVPPSSAQSLCAVRDPVPAGTDAIDAGGEPRGAAADGATPVCPHPRIWVRGTFLGFEKHTCEACGSFGLVGLRLPTRLAYGLGALLLVSLIVGVLPKRGMPIPAMVAITLLYALAQDVVVRRQNGGVPLRQPD